MTITIHIPQIILLVVQIIGIGYAIRDHGKPRSPENAWISLIGFAIIQTLLIWGGFYK